MFDTIQELNLAKDIFVCKFVNGNFVEFPHAALEREGGEEPFTVRGQAIRVVPKSKSIL